MNKQRSTKSESDKWFLIYGVADERTEHYRWIHFNKKDKTRSEVAKYAKMAANILGEEEYNYYFLVKRPYITDSISAFKKKCERISLNPDLSDLLTESE